MSFRRLTTFITGSKATSMTLLLLLCLCGATFSSCNDHGPKYEETDWEGMRPADSDPLPGDLVKKHIQEDSLKSEKAKTVKKNMSKVISEYRQRFKDSHFNGYFLTDFNDDGLPELWVKVGNYRENSKLELYYPLADGSLRKSDTPAQPGQYYVGKDYMIQVVGSGPGYININKIKIHNGEMDVENVRELDLYSDPHLTIPEFKEKEVHSTSLANLNPLNNAFK